MDLGIINEAKKAAAPISHHIPNGNELPEPHIDLHPKEPLKQIVSINGQKHEIHGITGQAQQLNAWGKTKEEAAKVARDMIRGEMSTLPQVNKGKWHNALNAAILEAGDDPAKLFGILAHLKAADQRIATNGIPDEFKDKHNPKKKHLHAGEVAVAGGQDAGPAIVGNIAPPDQTPQAAPDYTPSRGDGMGYA